MLSLLFCLVLHAQTIEVSAGQYVRYGTPVFVTLSKALQANQSYKVVNQKTHKSAPAQLTDSLMLAFILPDSLAPNTKAIYTLQKTSNNRKLPVTITHQAPGIYVSCNGKPIFVYHIEDAMPPADSPAYYKRNGFIHPLYSPKGQVLTDDFPAGHAHQHAIFTAWAGATFRLQVSTGNTGTPGFSLLVLCTGGGWSLYAGSRNALPFAIQVLCT